jgi:hypothetical protein
LALGIQLSASPYHFNELAAAEFEVDVLIVAEDRGVVCGSVLERLVDIALEDRCTYFWVLLAYIRDLRDELTLSIQRIQIFYCCLVWNVCLIVVRKCPCLIDNLV